MEIRRTVVAFSVSHSQTSPHAVAAKVARVASLEDTGGAVSFAAEAFVDGSLRVRAMLSNMKWLHSLCIHLRTSPRYVHEELVHQVWR